MDSGIYWQSGQGTVLAASDFGAEEAATKLKDAMKGLGTNEEEIIDVLTSYDLDQRIQIRDQYKTSFGADLIEDLKSELGGNFEDVCLALLTEPRKYDAQWLKKAMEGVGTKETALVEVLCPRTNDEIEGIKQAYRELSEGKKLEEDIMSETSGNFQRILVSQIQGGRAEFAPPDEDAARKDAEDIFAAGEDQLGTDESVFNNVLATRSLPQIQLISQLYEREVAERSLLDSISSETSGDVQTAYRTIVKYALDPAGYFAEVLHEAMSGGGTDDDTLQRVVIGHAEVDLHDIKQAYEEKYEKSLVDAVADDVSGDYGKILVKIIGQ